VLVRGDAIVHLHVDVNVHVHLHLGVRDRELFAGNPRPRRVVEPLVIADNGWSMPPRVLLFALAASAACATTSGSTASGTHEKTEIQMDPILVRNETDPLTGLDGYDASQLLELGNRLYANKDYDRAVKVFDRLIDTFSESELLPAAIYNSGLALEQLAEYAPALERFQRVVKEHPTAASWKDAWFRSSLCYGKLERWKEVADNYWAIRQLPSLTTMDELEARVGQGVGLFMQDDYATAEREFMQAVRFYEDKSREEYLPADYFMGQARFYLGEIAAREFEALKLEEPDVSDMKKSWGDMMGEKLEQKCELLLRAQNNFIRTIRAGHNGWATAAGFRIGSLYERLYDDMMQVPVPPGLGEDGKAFYLSEVRKKVGVLVTKAIKIYEQSLEMATRVGEKNEWVERTSKSLERMKSLYLDSFSNG
jgi:tetratricopeptide (TPR) repeat protein